MLCEVKTFNVSEEEALRRHRTGQGHAEAVRAADQLDDQFLLGKLSGTLASAVRQLDTEDPGRAAERIVFVVFHQDDRVGDYLPEYLAQIDKHLLQHPLVGARIVCAVEDLFGRIMSMQSAEVITF